MSFDFDNKTIDKQLIMYVNIPGLHQVVLSSCGSALFFVRTIVCWYQACLFSVVHVDRKFASSMTGCIVSPSESFVLKQDLLWVGELLVSDIELQFQDTWKLLFIFETNRDWMDFCFLYSLHAHARTVFWNMADVPFISFIKKIILWVCMVVCL